MGQTTTAAPAMCLLKVGCDGCMMARDLPKFLQDVIMAQTIQNIQPVRANGPRSQACPSGAGQHIRAGSAACLGAPAVDKLPMERRHWTPRSLRIFRSRQSPCFSFGLSATRAEASASAPHSLIKICQLLLPLLLTHTVYFF